MIYSDKGCTKIGGTGIEILAEFAEITHVLMKQFPKDIVEKTFRFGCMSEEQVKEERVKIEMRTEELKGEVLKLLKNSPDNSDTFNSVFGDLFDK